MQRRIKGKDDTINNLWKELEDKNAEIDNERKKHENMAKELKVLTQQMKLTSRLKKFGKKKRQKIRNGIMNPKRRKTIKST